MNYSYFFARNFIASYIQKDEQNFNEKKGEKEMAIFDNQEKLIGVVTCLEDAYRLVAKAAITWIDEEQDNWSSQGPEAGAIFMLRNKARISVKIIIFLLSDI